MINQEYIDSHPEQFKDFQQEFDNLWFGNLEEYFNHDAVDYANIRNIALHFVNWQYEQFENNRLTACDNMTKEEADREQEFMTDFIEKNNRVPTYSDAIEYGKRLMIDKACEYIHNHWNKLLVYEYNQFGGSVFNRKKTVEQFRKAMED